MKEYTIIHDFPLHYADGQWNASELIARAALLYHQHVPQSPRGEYLRQDLRVIDACLDLLADLRSAPGAHRPLVRQQRPAVDAVAPAAKHANLADPQAAVRLQQQLVPRVEIAVRLNDRAKVPRAGPPKRPANAIQRGNGNLDLYLVAHARHCTAAPRRMRAYLSTRSF